MSNSYLGCDVNVNIKVTVVAPNSEEARMREKRQLARLSKTRRASFSGSEAGGSTAGSDASGTAGSQSGYDSEETGSEVSDSESDK